MIGKEEYFDLYLDRPEKFTAEEVGFMPEAEDEKVCCACLNWFYSPMMNKSVCQVYRPADDGSVPAGASCYFWTKDNVSFPHLE